MTAEHIASGQRITSFERDGLVFDVADQGPLDGDVVLLLHGFPQTSSSWDELAPLLHGAGYRTLAPDQRGYSPRARPRGRFAYRMTALVGDMLALIDRVGRPVHVVGHDWGAAVAWTLAASRPDAVATLTALSVPHPAAFMRAVLTSSQFLKSWYMYFFQLPWLPERLVPLLSRNPSRLATKLSAGQSEANTRRDFEFLVTSGALTPAINWYRAMPFSRPGMLAKVTVPTLYIWSDGDAALGRKGADLARRYVTGPYTFRTLTGVGHFIPEQAAPDVAELMRPHLAPDEQQDR